MERGSTDQPVHISRRRLVGLSAIGAGLGYVGFRVLSRDDVFRYNTVEKPVPRVETAAYTLRVDGHADAPFTLSWDDLLRLPAVTQISDFRCVEGWGVDNVRWQGVRFLTLAEMAKPRADAGFVTFHSEGGVYRESLALWQALLPDVLLAYRMNNAPLTRDHGYPLRLVMPRMYGYKGPKWVNRVEFSRVRDAGYWVQRGWAIDAWIS